MLVRLPEWGDAGTVLCYISMDTEVETRKIIEEALGRRKRVIVPLYQPSAQSPLLSELRSLSELAPSAVPWLMEHALKHRRPVGLREVELAIAPGVVFDREGGRIGFGGGYFDRLFSLMPQAIRIGLSFSFQVHPQTLDLMDHDIKMHKIITESEIIAPRTKFSTSH